MFLILVLLITYFAMVHLFVGNSRYRITVEPALILLAVDGVSSDSESPPNHSNRLTRVGRYELSPLTIIFYLHE